MKKTYLVLTAISFSLSSIAQVVTTYAGKPNDDQEVNYESQSNKALNNTFFSSPANLCIDPNGKLYVTEKSKIRIVEGGKLYIRAGSLQRPTLAEGYRNATGTQSTFRNPGGMAADSDGDVYIADVDNHCIRKMNKFVNLGNGQVVSTFAGAAPTPGLPGNGTAGSTDATGTSARFNQPTDITIDDDGNLYVTDYLNFTIRRITPSGQVTTLAGSAGVEGTTDGSGTATRFGGPWGIAMYTSNTVVVSDPWNTNIRKVNIFSGATTTLAGPTTGADARIVDGSLSEARFRDPKGIAVIGGIIYVCDKNVIRAIDEANNTVTTFAGDESVFEIKDGSGTSAAFTELSGMVADDNGNLYVTENSLSVTSHVIRKITVNNLAPRAGFTASKRNVIVNEVVTLEDISGGETSTDRTWTFSPLSYKVIEGDLKSESLKVSFDLAGFYEVSLSITNSYGTDVKTEQNYFAVSTSGSNSVSTVYKNSNLVKLYPVPADNQVTIEVDPSIQLEHLEISLFSINGQKVKTIGALETLDTRDLPNGTYFITLTNDEISIAKKLVISHR